MVRAPALAVIAAVATAVPAPARAQGAGPVGGSVAQEGTVHVHVEADAPAVTLEQVVAGSGVRVMARPVCRAPCDQLVDARGPARFFFAGQGLLTSPQFVLAGRGNDVTLDVKAGSKARRAAGFALALLGGAGIVAGVSMLAVGGITTDPQVPPDKGLLAAGGVASGVGLGMLVGGIVLVVTTRTTFDFRAPVVSF